MSKIFEYECECGSDGFISELGMLEADWYICPECGRDVRDYEVLNDDGDVA